MIRPLLAGVLVSALVGASPAHAQDSSPVLTKEQQDTLTPTEVLDRLAAGNARFLAGENTRRDHSAQVRAAVAGQYPMAIVLSCVDSRVPVEDVFDLGIGDIFVARVAGNFENVDILGSMEFATAVAGSKLVLVLGHESCGAVKATIAGAELGNITPMLDNIEPALETHAAYAGDREGAEFLHLVTESNVRMTVDDIRERSEVLAGLEKEGKIAIRGALYDMDTGKVSFLD